MFFFFFLYCSFRYSCCCLRRISVVWYLRGGNSRRCSSTHTQKKKSIQQRHYYAAEGPIVQDATAMLAIPHPAERYAMSLHRTVTFCTQSTSLGNGHYTHTHTTTEPQKNGLHSAEPSTTPEIRRMTAGKADPTFKGLSVYCLSWLIVYCFQPDSTSRVSLTLSAVLYTLPLLYAIIVSLSLSLRFSFPRCRLVFYTQLQL
jgi:hypothetical protein